MNRAQRQFVRATLIGSLIALALDLLLLVGPEASLTTDPGLLGGFFDAQGRAFLDGRLAVPPGAVGFEGIVTDGQTYEYYGPILALLRLPVLLVTSGLDQRLTQLSMLLALLVLLVATAALHWRVRGWLRPAAALERGELALVGVLQVAVGAGSVALYLLGRPIVYHETELWGAALAVAALWAVLGVLRAPSARGVAVAGALAVLTINTRVTVGLAVVLALGVAFLVLLMERPVRRRLLVGLAVGALVAVGSSLAINAAKFGVPFGIPLDRQVASQFDPSRQAALAANDGTIFGPQFVPTQVLAVLRPDAVGSVRAFPFLGGPGDPPKVLGDVRFDTLQASLSAPTSMALLCLLTLVALVGAVRLPGRRRWATLGLLGAAAAGYAGVLSIGYVTTRYLADALPLLTLGGAIGLQTLVGAGRTGRGWLVAAIVLTAVGVGVNGGAGLLEQRLTGSTVNEERRASWVRTQDRIDDALGRSPRGLTRGARLPSAAGRRSGDLAITGSCDGLFVIDAFGNWAPVERTERTGRLRFSLTGGDDAPTLVGIAGTGADRVLLLARRSPRGLRLALRTVGGEAPFGPPIPIGARARLELSFDPSLFGQQLAVARVDGEPAASLSVPMSPAGSFSLGADARQPGVAPFPGAILKEPLGAPVCRRLARRAGLL
ncbi:MAG: hypothetical protein H0V81_17920 [Solirubrobacterales bacterium]|nr:hypothetical protein [Solirubrobacterales bacterium]